VKIKHLRVFEGACFVLGREKPHFFEIFPSSQSHSALRIRPIVHNLGSGVATFNLFLPLRVYFYECSDAAGYVNKV
jgi:hypothetical protein